ncbi:phage tail tip lysozyme, partial [Lactobacillus crispatus]
AAAGVLGNIAQESKFNTSAVNASDNGAGLIQWTFARTTALKSFAEKKGKSWTDLDVQIEMLENDMKNQAMWTSGKFKDNSLKTFG